MTRNHPHSNGDLPGSDDPVLDSFLAEMLGGNSPPDLTARILQRQAEAQRAHAKQARADSMLPPAFGSIAAAAREEAGINLHQQAGTPQVLPVAPAPRKRAWVGNGRAGRQRRAQRRTVTMYITAAALSAVMVGVAVGLVAWKQVQQTPGGGAIAENPSVPSNVPESAEQPQQRHASGSSSEQIAREQRPSSKTNLETESGFGKPPAFSIAQDTAPSQEEPVGKPTAQPLYDEQVVALLDNHLEQAWAEAGIEPSAVAADSEWARRVYLRVLGRIPTVAELTDYMRDESSEKQAKLLDQLLTSPQYAPELAENWAEFWTNVLIGRRGGMQEDSLAYRDGLTDYLRASLAENKPLDKIAYELLTAEGANRPSAPDYNPAVNFLLASYDDQAKLATNRTTQVFLGQQLQCSQCHNHHVNEWPQQQYWQVNAFFRQMRAEKERGNKDIVRLVDRDFRGASGSYDEAEVFYEQINGVGKVAYPVWLDGEAINPSGRVSEVRRRVELARRVVNSEKFSRAIVNRLWDHFLGRGFTKPVDDMGPHNPPSHPEVLDRLSEQFAAHEHDLRQLIRWIALSEPFNLSSRPSPTNLADTAETPQRPLFSRYYTRQMDAEELYDSLTMLADTRSGAATSSGLGSGNLLAKRDFVGQFARDMNTDEGNEIINFEGSMQQSLSMMNGELMERATDADSANILRRVLNNKEMKWGEKIEHLFLAALSRQPTRRELQVADRLAASHNGNQEAALQDLWWALLNSNEFILDH